MRYLLFFLTLLSYTLYPNNASAYTCTVASDFNISIPNLYLQSTGAPNDKVGSVYTAPTKNIITCSDTSGITSQSLKFKAIAYSVGTQSIDNAQVYWANGTDNGIVYAIGATASCGTGGFVKPYTSHLIVLCAATFTGNVTPQVQFYQNTYSSNISVSAINKTYAGDVLVFINNVVAYKVPVYFNAAKVATAPCTVSTSVISVQMDNVDKRSFKGVGSTAGGKDFAISLNCNKATKVALQINSSLGSPNNTLGLVAINSGTAAAKGVAIQLINNQTGNVFPLATPVTLNNATTGKYDISLKAIYYQIAKNLTAGSVNASATFTITYP